MQTLLVNRAVSMSQFKKNPAAVLRQAEGRPVAVLNHNRVGFYLLEPPLLQVLLEELGRLRQADPAHAGAAPHQQLIEALLSQAKAASA
ncbi:MAG: prevent-host-death protein [Hylemonella sp.]|nr:prevent-host-death protein [Hylemonella sp.]